MASTSKDSASNNPQIDDTSSDMSDPSDEEYAPEQEPTKKTRKRSAKKTNNKAEPSSSKDESGPSQAKKQKTPVKKQQLRGKGKFSAKSDNNDTEVGKENPSKSVKKSPLTAAKKAELKKMIYQFKISLLGTEVWRRIQISGKSSFFDLYSAIHKAMGWLGVHLLHHFEAKNPKTDSVERFAVPGAIMEVGESTYKNEKDAKIVDYFITPNDKASYLYTFGEGWEHEVLFEKTLIPALKATYPKCSGGKLACPPEDCGGVEGYHRIVDIVKNPSHEEYEETIEWLADQGYKNYNPDKFVPKNAFKIPKPKAVWMWLPSRR